MNDRTGNAITRWLKDIHTQLTNIASGGLGGGGGAGTSNTTESTQLGVRAAVDALNSKAQAETLGTGSDTAGLRVALSTEDRAALGGAAIAETGVTNVLRPTGTFTIPAGSLSYAVTIVVGTTPFTFDGETYDPAVASSIGDEIIQVSGKTRTFGAMNGDVTGNTDVIVQYQT